MLDIRKPETPHSLLERCLGWILPARRHAPLVPQATRQEPHPVNVIAGTGTRRPVVEHTRAGDVYRL